MTGIQKSSGPQTDYLSHNSVPCGESQMNNTAISHKIYSVLTALCDVVYAPFYALTYSLHINEHPPAKK